MSDASEINYGSQNFKEGNPKFDFNFSEKWPQITGYSYHSWNLSYFLIFMKFAKKNKPYNVDKMVLYLIYIFDIYIYIEI